MPANSSNTVDGWLRENEPLAPRTTWGIGGAAELFAEPPDEARLASLAGWAAEQGACMRLLGGGSNILVAEGVLLGLTVSTRNLRRIEIDVDAATAVVEAGAPLARLVRRTVEAGLGGLEHLAGIPGSVGGAVAMNAGVPGWEIGACVERVEGIDFGGDAVSRSSEAFATAYRDGGLEGVSATRIHFRLRREQPEILAEGMRERLDHRRRTQPRGVRSAGCVFRNPPDDSAGRLIDAAGCKGMREGAMVVSPIHANFFINEGGATWDDALRLMDRVRDAVRRRFDIILEPEVRLWRND